MSHTPGPWLWGYWKYLYDEKVWIFLEKSPEEFSDNKSLSLGPYGRKTSSINEIIDVDGYDSEGYFCENPDDAHLIAAAPDMLEALIMAADQIDSLGDYADLTLLDNMRAVIAKAKGGRYDSDT